MKHLMLNKDSVIIDIVDEVKPVKKNRNGITVLCTYDEAQGFIGSDNDTIYAKFGQQFQPNYSDIAKIYAVDEVESLVEPLAYKYDPEEGFTENEDAYPETNLKLTTKSIDIEDMILELSEAVYGE